jgi:hypothetical protein
VRAHATRTSQNARRKREQKSKHTHTHTHTHTRYVIKLLLFKWWRERHLPEHWQRNQPFFFGARQATCSTVCCVGTCACALSARFLYYVRVACWRGGVFRLLRRRRASPPVAPSLSERERKARFPAHLTPLRSAPPAVLNCAGVWGRHLALLVCVLSFSLPLCLLTFSPCFCLCDASLRTSAATPTWAVAAPRVPLPGSGGPHTHTQCAPEELLTSLQLACDGGGCAKALHAWTCASGACCWLMHCFLQLACAGVCAYVCILLVFVLPFHLPFLLAGLSYRSCW